MQIQGIGSISAGLPAGAASAGAQEAGGFGEMLEQMIDSLNESSAGSTDAATALATGDDVDLHQVVMASEMESIAFNLALQVRNKVVEAYHEIMRMPI
jgi:flagellar hook-basal body complex protein FliE